MLSVYGLQCPQTFGCTDPVAENYDPVAEFDDGSCIIIIDPCNNLTSITFQGAAPTVGISAFFGMPDAAVAYVVASTSFGASGADWNGLTVDPILKWTTTAGEVTITDCNEAATGELIIPDTIEGNPVTSIGESAFYYCRSLTSITIPDRVTSIGDIAI